MLQTNMTLGLLKVLPRPEPLGRSNGWKLQAQLALALFHLALQKAGKLSERDKQHQVDHGDKDQRGRIGQQRLLRQSGLQEFVMEIAEASAVSLALAT